MVESSIPLLLRIDDILRHCNLKRRAFQNMRLIGKFPPPSQRCGKVQLWHRDLVEKWCRGEWRPDKRPARYRKAAVAR